VMIVYISVTKLPSLHTHSTDFKLLDSELLVLTATGQHAYRRPEDGVYVIPIGCLKD
jgi:hypothetical protein